MGLCKSERGVVDGSSIFYTMVYYTAGFCLLLCTATVDWRTLGTHLATILESLDPLSWNEKLLACFGVGT